MVVYSWNVAFFGTFFHILFGIIKREWTNAEEEDIVKLEYLREFIKEVSFNSSIACLMGIFWGVLLDIFILSKVECIRRQWYTILALFVSGSRDFPFGACVFCVPIFLCVRLHTWLNGYRPGSVYELAGVFIFILLFLWNVRIIWDQSISYGKVWCDILKAGIKLEESSGRILRYAQEHNGLLLIPLNYIASEDIETKKSPLPAAA